MPIFIPDTGGGTPPPATSADSFSVTSLVEETLGNLGGHTMDPGAWTYLLAPMSDSTLSMQVKDPARIKRGIAEVGEELMLVEQTSDTGVTVAPFGRGWQATPKSSHQPNERVTFGPRFPRFRVRQTINQLIESAYPTLFAVGTHEFDADGIRVTYELPDDVEQVLEVEQETYGPTGDWRSLNQWRFDRDASTSEYASGRALDIWGGLDVGRTVHVKYARRPTALASTAVWTDSGLNESAWPAFKYGAMWQLVASQEAGMSGLDSVNAEEGSGRRVSPIQLSERYYALHLQLMQQERERLLKDHPATMNFELH